MGIHANHALSEPAATLPPMTDARFPHAHPDDRAECPNCGALVRVAAVKRHDRFHAWLEDALTAPAADIELVEWPTDPEPEEPDEVPDEARVDAFGSAPGDSFR